MTDTTRPPEGEISCDTCGEVFEYPLEQPLSLLALQERERSAAEDGWVTVASHRFCPTCAEEVFGEEA